jgi:hypothetical protein
VNNSKGTEAGRAALTWARPGPVVVTSVLLAPRPASPSGPDIVLAVALMSTARSSARYQRSHRPNTDLASPRSSRCPYPNETSSVLAHASPRHADHGCWHRLRKARISRTPTRPERPGEGSVPVARPKDAAEQGAVCAGDGRRGGRWRPAPLGCTGGGAPPGVCGTTGRTSAPAKVPGLLRQHSPSAPIADSV